MTNNEQNKGLLPWIAAKGNPQKQSNYGRYKTSVYRGEGMNLQTVIITADTPELAKEIADLATRQDNTAELVEAWQPIEKLTKEHKEVVLLTDKGEKVIGRKNWNGGFTVNGLPRKVKVGMFCSFTHFFIVPPALNTKAKGD